MSKTNEPVPDNRETELPGLGDFDNLARASKGGLFSRLGERFNEALQQGRGSSRHRNAVDAMRRSTALTGDDETPRRARNVTLRRMVIPEGVTVEGSLCGGAESEIGGRIEGDLTVEGALFLLKSAIITGNVRAGSCQMDGLVEGRIDVSSDLAIGKTGRLNADAVAGRNVDIAGQVHGSVTTPGRLKMAAGSVVNGDVRVRVLHMEEGAALNGVCTMRAPGQKAESAAPTKEYDKP
jgi:cytoskeletal protein CcmA (bactofilin family)